MGHEAPPRFGEDEAAVTILHVSDVQFGKHHRFADAGGGFDTLLQRLCEDLDLLREQNGLEPDLIALTGDLAEWGMRRELEQVAVFAERLRAHLELEPDRLLVVPGNHDINRMLCESYFLRCAGEGDDPRPPYWPKWEPYAELFGRLYREVDRYRFTELEPWTLFEIPSLKVVVAGLNSTIHESHRDEDHHGFLGEEQLRWFAGRLAEYEDQGWLRIGLVHHNAVRRAAADDENLRDADDLREILGERLHVLLHGHTHQGRVEMLGPSLPVVSTGSAAVKRDQRPGPSPDEPGETPNQYQLVRITRGGLWCAAREYTHERKRWIGDNRVSSHGDRWWYSLDRAWPRATATFPPPASGPSRPDDDAAPDDEAAEGARMPRGREEDLLDDVIEWCRLRGEGRIAEVTRVRHRGPWGDYAKVHDRERGIGLLGAYQGELTPEVLERWVADVHAPFRGRGQPVSKLVVATSAIDPALCAAAQARGVDVERMIDYQRVLDTTGYAEKLRERLTRDREYPSEYYLEQRMTVWSPLRTASERVERAADWLSARLLEREGAFVLVLGSAGIGKTFLMREVARRLGQQQAITPILVELRDLERAHTIEELAATQFTRFGVPWHPRAFRRDLEEGRLALLFDGFDELALRVRSAAIPVHFERIYSAAVERARIVVSSRTEHFLSSGHVADLMTPSSTSATPLGGLLERVQRRLVLEVHPFEQSDVAECLRRRLGDRAGEARFTRLASIHDLVDLARNPRMLGFLVDIPDDMLAQAADRGGSITSDALYRMVVDDAWLAAEAERLSPPGAAPGPSAEALRDAATNLALQLWRNPGGSILAQDVGAHVSSMLARMCDDDLECIVHTTRARTLLTRDDRGRLSFIHQTVLEWLVVGRLAGEMTGEAPGAHLDVGRLNAFMIDLLRERLDEDVLARWAEARLAAPTTSVAAENAREVLRRLGREATARAVMRDQDLRGQTLEGQRLRDATLDGSDLTGARLVGRDLSGASLVGAQLAYADLTEASLRGTDLTGANLAFARLHRTDLEGARLAGARLTGASLLDARGVPPLDEARAVGIALAVPASIEMMYARATWAECRVAINPDGTLLASGHEDGRVRLWDCTRGQLLRMLAGHRGRVWSVAFSPDGKTLASGGDDHTVRIWHVTDGRERMRLSGHRGAVWSVAFSPDSETLASADNHTLLLWHVADGRERMRLSGHGAPVWSVAFSPDGKTLASATDDHTVRLWNVANGRQRMRLIGHQGAVVSVAFSPDGKTIASGATDHTVRLWSAQDGSQHAPLTGHLGRVLAVAFSPDGKTIASGAADHTVRLWNAADGSRAMRLDGHRGRVLSVAFSPDGRTLVSGSDDNSIGLWDVRDGRRTMRTVRLGGSILSVSFSPDGKTVACGTTDNAVRLWSIEDGSERACLLGRNGSVPSVAFSPNGRTFASGGTGTVRIWDARTGIERTRMVEHRSTIRSVAFSPDGRTIAGSGDDALIRLWDTGTGNERTQLTGHRGPVLSVAFSPDGRTLASGATDNMVRIWSVKDGSPRARLTGHRGRVLCVAFSPDGKTLASGAADDTLRLWSTDDGSPRGHPIKDRGDIWSVAFSPDGKTLASGSSDAMVQLWSATDGSKREHLVGHRGGIMSVAFSPDGKTLASGSEDATLRLWDVASGHCLAIFYATAHGAVAARPDGRYRVRGDVAGQFWHVIGLHRYEIGELDALVPGLRLADDEPLYERP